MDKKCILYVEDDEMVSDLITDVLVRAGFSVINARSVEEAQKVLNSSGVVDLILCDGTLDPQQKGGGADWAYEKRQEGAKVIIYSGETESQRPGVPLLMKPVPWAVLLKTVRDVLEE